MSNESKRRKDNCIECGDFKPIKARNCCQNCHHKYKRRNVPRFYLSTRYSEIKQRCINLKYKRSDIYNGKLDMTREGFIKKFINDITFLRLFKEWQDSGFQYKLAPSIDRINNDGNYHLDNIQIITHGANSSKDQETVPLLVYKNGKIFTKFKSILEAAKVLKVHTSNIHKVLNGKRNHTGGYYFEIDKS